MCAQALTRRTLLSSVLSLGMYRVAAAAPPDFSQFNNFTREQAMDWMLNSSKLTVELNMKTILSSVSKTVAGRLTAADLRYELQEQPFSFYSHGQDYPRQTINISLGGISALDICALAMVLSQVQLSDTSWWFKYLLYHRKLRKQPNSSWIEPFDAAGMSSVTDQSEEAVRSATLLSVDMTLFVVAHEAGHVALQHRFGPYPNETESDLAKRRRKQELEADRFALDILKTSKTDLFAASYTTLAHLILMHEKEPSVPDSSHPADHERLLQIANYEKPASAKTRELSKFAATFEKSGPLGISGYDVLDTMADEITLDKLRIWKR
ncbi:hypothetical protein [Bradyrhizobium sp. CCGUVB23]|uniref:hypothetical protein n=1 Tax=Bradyrhizobium sp. CCGUVB23 TaxID=2949630 RepID=UPI0020B1B8BF|nr:hypothetical protein [Bradyrhizobium sp. CCGUVB23]MCP3460719.1 hypothetical protein [Bradyrhizobium sp. CCGUVB23]